MGGVKVKAAIATLLVIALVLVVASLVPSVIPPPWYVVASRSMEPTLHVGDLVIAFPANPADIREGPHGDIIIYRSPDGKLIIHRVVDKVQIAGSWRFLTKGDNNPYPDQEPLNPSTWVPEDRVLAKMVFAIPLVGYPFLESVKPFTEAVLIIALAFLLYSSFSKEKEGVN